MPDPIPFTALSTPLRDWIVQRTEPGMRWYSCGSVIAVYGLYPHAWAAWEQQYAAELASGEVCRVVDVPEEEQAYAN